MRWCGIAIVALVVVAACRETVTSTGTGTGTNTASAAPGSTSCDHDDDCIVSNFAGCCACPQCRVADPHAVTRAQEKLREDSCAVVECDMGPCNVGGMCKPGEPAAHFAAHCVDHACTMTRR